MLIDRINGLLLYCNNTTVEGEVVYELRDNESAIFNTTISNGKIGFFFLHTNKYNIDEALKAIAQHAKCSIQIGSHVLAEYKKPTVSNLKPGQKFRVFVYGKFSGAVYICVEQLNGKLAFIAEETGLEHDFSKFQDRLVELV